LNTLEDKLFQMFLMVTTAQSSPMGKLEVAKPTHLWVTSNLLPQRGS